MANTYSMKQLGRALHWVSGSQLPKFLEAQGIRPSSELQMGSRTYRQYDEAALTKCQELSKEHARKKADVKPHAVPSNSEDVLQTLHTLLKATDMLIQAVGSMQPKLADIAHRTEAVDAKVAAVVAAMRGEIVFDDVDFSKQEAA